MSTPLRQYWRGVPVARHVSGGGVTPRHTTQQFNTPTIVIITANSHCRYDAEIVVTYATVTIRIRNMPHTPNEVAAAHTIRDETTLQHLGYHREYDRYRHESCHTAPRDGRNAVTSHRISPPTGHAGPKYTVRSHATYAASHHGIAATDGMKTYVRLRLDDAARRSAMARARERTYALATSLRHWRATCYYALR